MAWHADYESIGPFEYDNLSSAIKEDYFKSIHFNLTENGGALTTMDTANGAYIMNCVIKIMGIFSWAHYILNYICTVFTFAHMQHPNIPNFGNAFNNMKLHCVTAGKTRLSYVVRMAKKGRVSVSHASIDRAIQRSENCKVFEKFKKLIDRDESKYVECIDWKNHAEHSG